MYTYEEVRDVEMNLFQFCHYFILVINVARMFADCGPSSHHTLPGVDLLSNALNSPSLRGGGSVILRTQNDSFVQAWNL